MNILNKLLILTLFSLSAEDLLAEHNTFSEQVLCSASTVLSEKARATAQSLNSQHYNFELEPLPGNLNLPLCSHAPSVSFISSKEHGPQRMRLTCESPSWSIFMKGTINIYLPVLVSRRSLESGYIPAATDFSLVEHDISTLRRGYFSSPGQLKNQEISKRVDAGEVLTPSMLRTAEIIKRGNRVTLTASSNGYYISMPGEALENGALNEQIRVKNLSSNKVVFGIVRNSAEVEAL